MSGVTGPGIALIVDDDLDSLNYFGGVLESHGWEIVLVDEAPQVFAMLQERQGLVVLDTSSPAAFATCDQIKRERSLAGVPVIMVTDGPATPVLLDHWYSKTPADAYVRKPTSYRLRTG